MAEKLEIIEESLDQILEQIEQPVWATWDFGLFLVLSLFGIFVSWLGVRLSKLSFEEAREAKKAAKAAGKTVKVQTVTIELSEIIQRLDVLEPRISFADARNLHTEISRRLRRLTASLPNEPEVQSTIAQLRRSLDRARTALDGVQPEASPQRTDYIVYNAMEGHFSNVSGCVADLMGLLERRTIDVGVEQNELS